MKVIKVDNFDRDWVDDHLVAESLTKEDAEVLAMNLNHKHSGVQAPWFFRVVEDDYKLKVREP